MTTGMRKRGATIAVLLAIATLAGCLTKEGSDPGATGGGNQTQNNPPTISGIPQTAIMMGNTYSFKPTASDPDGDSLTFSVRNRPLWASFDSSTGQLSGQPSLSDVGVFQRIEISVSDGMATTSLPEYSITVSQVQLGSMTLSWTPPTQNTDGTVLTDLAGYRIYYGPSEGNYPNRVIIDTAGLASYVVENLVPDTYYVVATSVNAMGVESTYSNVAIKTVQ